MTLPRTAAAKAIRNKKWVKVDKIRMRSNVLDLD